jgi:diguanylate cyclase (GGDEF)-like protein
MGGEEFIVIAPNTDLAAISILSERIRDRVEKLQPEHLKLPRLITISIGAAVSCSHIDLDGWQQTLKRSDQALYFAKASGRNNCKISEGSLTTPDRE